MNGKINNIEDLSKIKDFPIEKAKIIRTAEAEIALLQA